jgi:hypothetical protein
MSISQHENENLEKILNLFNKIQTEVPLEIDNFPLLQGTKKTLKFI